MIIYLQHPQHGQKVATSDMEAEYDETNGWVRYNPDTPSEAVEPEAVNTLKRRRKTSE
jgi:hypothetical protein